MTSHLIAGLLLALTPRASAESLTMVANYPSPVGIYKKLFSTDQTILARDGGNVGLGTTDPLAKLHVEGQVRINSGLRLATSSGLGWKAGIATGGGGDDLTLAETDDNAGVGTLRAVMSAGGFLGLGMPFPGPRPNVRLHVDGAVNILSSAGGTLQLVDREAAAAIRLSAFNNGTQFAIDSMPPASSDPLLFGAAVRRFTMEADGDLRIGTGTTGCVKDANGTIIAGTCSSDARLKMDILPLSGAAERLSKLRPVSYAWRTSKFPQLHLPSGRQYGLIGQEVAQTAPELATTDAEGYKAVRYGVELQMLMLEAIKEQQDEIRKLRGELDALKAKP